MPLTIVASWFRPDAAEGIDNLVVVRVTNVTLPDSPDRWDTIRIPGPDGGYGFALNWHTAAFPTYARENLVEIVFDGDLPHGYLKNDCFANCVRLRKVRLPDSLRVIGYKAFMGCTALQDVVIPDSVEKIYEEAFMGCDALTCVIVPASVTKVGPRAFAACKNLHTLVLLCDIDDIGMQSECMFSACANLRTLVVGPRIRHLCVTASWYNNLNLHTVVALHPNYARNIPDRGKRYGPRQHLIDSLIFWTQDRYRFHTNDPPLVPVNVFAPEPPPGLYYGHNLLYWPNRQLFRAAFPGQNHSAFYTMLMVFEHIRRANYQNGPGAGAAAQRPWLPPELIAFLCRFFLTFGDHTNTP